MTPETTTLIVGLAGIGATLISSALGLYFTAQARSSALRESLFNQQLALVQQLIFKQARARVFLTVLTDKGGPYEEQARDDVGEVVREYSELQEKGAAVLPTELWVEIKKLNGAMTDLLIKYDSDGGIVKEDLDPLVARDAKVALLSRVSLGIDELTAESLKLYSSESEFSKVASLEVEHFLKMQERVNA
jgi:hypothetical protein